MKKTNILFIPSDRQGVGHYRSIWAYKHMHKNYSNEFDVKIDLSPNVKNIDELAKFDIIHFHRSIGEFTESVDIINELKNRGVKMIMDIDDYWNPPSTHPLYEIIQKDKVYEKIEANLRASSYVTTTTNIFEKRIKEFNENTFVIPNALDLNQDMWKTEAVENKNDKVRISWIGGSSHLYDLQLLIDSFEKLNFDASLKDKFQIIMCGFDVRGTVTEINQHGHRNQRNIKPHETIWLNFERIFTSNYNLIGEDKEYIEWLKKIKNEEYPNMYDKNYIRRWTLPLTKYGYHYDYCDVCLAPLATHYRHKTPNGQVINKLNIFNEVKSELKVIESGIKKKVLIAQDFGAYSDTIKDGETGILVSDNGKGWYKAIKQVINDKDYREHLSTNLHNWVKDKYNLDNINEQRVAFYREIMK